MIGRSAVWRSLAQVIVSLVGCRPVTQVLTSSNVQRKPLVGWLAKMPPDTM